MGLYCFKARDDVSPGSAASLVTAANYHNLQVLFIPPNHRAYWLVLLHGMVLTACRKRLTMSLWRWGT